MLASQARGATRLTADIDIWPRWTMENLARLARALAELDARIKIEEGSIETLAVPLDAKTIWSLEERGGRALGTSTSFSGYLERAGSISLVTSS